MKTIVINFVTTLILHEAVCSANHEVDVLMQRFARVSREAEAHKPDLTGDDISAFGDIKNQIHDLIDKNILEATGQTYSWYAGMELEFYKVKSDDKRDQNYVSIISTSKSNAKERNGGPPNWAYDSEGKKYLDLRDGSRPIAHVYFKDDEETEPRYLWRHKDESRKEEEIKKPEYFRKQEYKLKKEDEDESQRYLWQRAEELRNGKNI